jgi:hypothetical protein
LIAISFVHFVLLVYLKVQHFIYIDVHKDIVIEEKCYGKAAAAPAVAADFVVVVIILAFDIGSPWQGSQ